MGGGVGVQWQGKVKLLIWGETQESGTHIRSLLNTTILYAKHQKHQITQIR